MDRKIISSLGIVLLVGLTLTGCAGYYSGYGHYDYPYLGYYDYPYYDYGNRYYGYPYDRHERGEHHREFGEHRGERGGPSMHREMGVAPRFQEHHAPASAHTEHSGSMNRAPTPRMPAHGNQHGSEHDR